MGELLDSMEPIRTARRGDVVEGVVMRADADGILVHIGHKAEGVVPPKEMRTLNPEDLDSIKVGDDILTFVVRPETGDGGAPLRVMFGRAQPLLGIADPGAFHGAHSNLMAGERPAPPEWRAGRRFRCRSGRW